MFMKSPRLALTFKVAIDSVILGKKVAEVHFHLFYPHILNKCIFFGRGGGSQGHCAAYSDWEMTLGQRRIALLTFYTETFKKIGLILFPILKTKLGLSRGCQMFL